MKAYKKDVSMMESFFPIDFALREKLNYHFRRVCYWFLDDCFTVSNYIKKVCVCRRIERIAIF